MSEETRAAAETTTAAEQRERARAGGTGDAEVTGGEAHGAGAGTRAVEGSVEIDAPPERVWRALTEAAELERWFPLEARVEPGEGGSIWMSWKNEYAGASEILAWDPPRLLRISWGSPEDAAQAQVTEYLLEGRGGRTLLRVVTSGFPADASWDDWVEGTRRGWAFELRSLKHYLERHAGEDREVIYLRRRVSLSPEEAWGRLADSGALEGRWLRGRPFDEAPPLQYAAVLDDPPDTILRVSNEPCHPDPEARDVTLWLSAWGKARGRLPEVEAEWSRLLEQLYPEGVTV